jgi:SAM-dependent methyltransferase
MFLSANPPPTGRIALPLAEKGLSITGVDISDGMLAVARRKMAARPVEVRDRLTLIHQDMSALDLGRSFGFAFVPARSFTHLLTINLQRRSLDGIRRHLRPPARLAIHLFDPRLDLLDPDIAQPGHSGTDPDTGLRYTAEVLQTRFDHLNQVRRDRRHDRGIAFPTRNDRCTLFDRGSPAGLLNERADEVFEWSNPTSQIIAPLSRIPIAMSRPKRP